MYMYISKYIYSNTVSYIYKIECNIDKENNIQKQNTDILTNRRSNAHTGI